MELLWHNIFDVITDFGSTFSGVLTDELGRVQAVWGSFSTQVHTLQLFPAKSL